MRRLAVSAALAVALLVMTACGGGGASSTAVAWHGLDISVPATLAGYAVADEKAADSKLQKGSGADALIDAGRLFSFRQGSRLFATLEIAELKQGVAADSPQFQTSVISQISGSILRPTTIGSQRVYQGTGNRELVYAWFKGRLMHVMLTHDVKDPQPLVAAALALP